MKVFAYILVSCTIILFITGCHTVDNSIEYYIDHYCDFSKNDTCYIDIRKVLNVDYDSMYIFYWSTTSQGVRNITGVEEYGDYKNPDKGSFVCSDDYRILLIKNGKIVYNRLCYSSTKKIHINMESFILVKGDGYFDGKVVDDQGYFAPNPIFMVVKDKQSMEYDIYALGF